MIKFANNYLIIQMVIHISGLKLIWSFLSMLPYLYVLYLIYKISKNVAL